VLLGPSGCRFHAARAPILTRLWAKTPCPHQVRTPKCGRLSRKKVLAQHGTWRGTGHRRTVNRNGCWTDRPSRTPGSIPGSSTGEDAPDGSRGHLQFRPVRPWVVRSTMRARADEPEEEPEAFRDKIKWRTGSEGRINHIKRSYGCPTMASTSWIARCSRPLRCPLGSPGKGTEPLSSATETAITGMTTKSIAEQEI
jgi:hypothetical protein